MRKKDLQLTLEQRMPKAVEYGMSIILGSPRFAKFAVDLTDFMGEDFIPYCKSVYSIVRQLSAGFVPQDEVDGEFVVNSFSEDDIALLYDKFKTEQALRKRREEFAKDIDELQFNIREFRSTEKFRRCVDFIGRNRYLSPYNAMLVDLQKPGARFVMTGKKWCEEYNRIPKLNAQKLIALVPFGPVQVMYDICDTEYDSDFDGERFTDDELMAKLEDVLISVRGEVADGKMRQLMANLPYCGVYIDDNFVATNSFGGYICRYDKSRLHLYVKDGLYINPYCKYALSVNNRFGSAAKFGTICHELAHLLCGHLKLRRAV